MGTNRTKLSANRQQISYEVFPNKNQPTYVAERMRLRSTVEVSHHARSRYAKYRNQVAKRLSHASPRVDKTRPNNRFIRKNARLFEIVP